MSTRQGELMAPYLRRHSTAGDIVAAATTEITKQTRVEANGDALLVAEAVRVGDSLEPSTARGSAARRIPWVAVASAVGDNLWQERQFHERFHAQGYQVVVSFVHVHIAEIVLGPVIGIWLYTDHIVHEDPMEAHGLEACGSSRHGHVLAPVCAQRQRSVTAPNCRLPPVASATAAA
jgi:hypothetical protein